VNRRARAEQAGTGRFPGGGVRGWREVALPGIGAVRDASPPTVERRARPVSCVGREEELGLLDRLLDRSAAGRLGVALIDGEAGIGKTRLLQEALSHARARGFAVLYGAADEMDQTRPLSTLMHALEPVLPSSDPDGLRLARLIAGDTTLPTQRTTFATDLRHQVVRGVIELLERLATKQPVALGLDDLHWADQSTLLVVRALARATLAGRVVLISCMRPFPSSRELQRVVEELTEIGASRIALGPLDDGAVAELAEAVVGAPPGAGLREQLRRVGGNSLFIVELLSALVRDGLVDIADGAADIDDCVSIPADMRATLLRRLDALAPETAQTLRLAALLGSTFEVTDLSLLVGRSVVQLMPELREALKAAVLEESGGDRLAFRHELVRKAIYEDLAPGLRSALHREAGLALAAAGAPALKVAGQLALGAGVGDAQAVAWLRQAAREAGSRAPSIALQLLRQAVELTPPTDPDRLADVVDLIYALLWTGRGDEALAMGQEGLQAAALDSAAECELRLAMAWALLLAARTDEARLHIDIARGLREPSSRGGPGLDVAEAVACLVVGDLDGAVRLSDLASAGGDAAECSSLSLRGAVARRQGRTEEALALAGRAVELAGRSENADALRWTSWLELTDALIDADRFTEAETRLRAGEQRCTDFGEVWSLPLCRVRAARLRYLAGRWDEALAEIEEGLRLADEVGVQLGRRELLAYRALIACHRNDLPAATAALRASNGDRGRGDLGCDLMLWARALFEEARGHAPAAREVLSAGWPTLMQTAPSSCVLVGPRFVRLLVAEGRRDEAEAVRADVERVAGTMGTVSASAAALRCAGLLADDPQPLLEAVVAIRGLDRAPALAAVSEDAGDALVRAGRMADGRRLLEEAHRLYDGLLAVHDRARVGAALRRTGVRSAARGARRARPVTGPDSLTPAQRAVAGLVAEGLSNADIAQRLFISRRTVETHVAHAFKKLNVRSRAELRRVVRPDADAAGVDGPDRDPGTSGRPD